MVESVPGNRPLQELAEISEHLFATGINWGRIVVFFYFAYRVIEQVKMGKQRKTLEMFGGKVSALSPEASRVNLLHSVKARVIQ